MSHRVRIRIRHHRRRRRLLRLLLWPFRALLGLVAGIIGLAGRFVALLLGVVFIVVGALVSLTIVGAIIGIPLALFGLLLVVRSLS